MQGKVYQDIIKEREHQIERWGDPSHDDQHTVGDWAAIIDSYVVRLDNAKYDPDRSEVRRRLVQIGALAVAAIESFDRKAGA